MLDWTVKKFSSTGAFDYEERDGNFKLDGGGIVEYELNQIVIL